MKHNVNWFDNEKIACKCGFESESTVLFERHIESENLKEIIDFINKSKKITYIVTSNPVDDEHPYGSKQVDIIEADMLIKALKEQK